jgi:membrane associated rhomboid family serine protease
MFIPIRDDQPTIRQPVVTIGLIVLNSLVFLATYLQGPEGFQLFTYRFGYIPAELVHSVELTPQMAVSPYITMFTSMFMHGGWMHLIGNMLFLWIFGNNVEDYFGHVWFILFYLLSGLAAVALQTIFDASSQVPMIGASGAIAGVMGGYMILHPRARITVLLFLFFFIQFVALPAKVVLGIWFVYQLLMSLGATGEGGVAFLAHVGGFVFGLAVLWMLTKIRGKGSTPSGGQRVYKMQW